MKENQREAIALFRYGVLAPFIQRQTDINQPWTYFHSVENKKFEYIDGSYRQISTTTMHRWYLAYQEKGFDGLKPERRQDLGKRRKMDEDLKATINFYISEYPRLPATQIYEKLLDTGVIKKSDLSLSTITRYVSSQKKLKHLLPITEKRRYEKEHINEVWYGDTTHASYITINGKKHKVYIIALIDDASRMIVGCEAFLEDTFINLMKVIKSAVSKYGKPKLFSFDNGSNYKCKQMDLLGARIGVGVHHCPAYTPVSKAKIERFFRTLKDQYLCLIKPNDYHDLESYNKDLKIFIQKYNTNPHTSLEDNISPTDRFFQEGEKIIELSEDVIEKCFLLEIERKVSPDCVIKIDAKEYEVDYHYQNQKIRIRYAPDLSSVYVVDSDDETLKEIKLLDKQANSHVKREKVKLSEIQPL